MKPGETGDKFLPTITIIVNSNLLGAYDNYLVNLWNQLHSLISEQWVFISNSFGTLVSLLLTDASDMNFWLEGISFCCISQSFIFRSPVLTHETFLSASNKCFLLNNLPLHSYFQMITCGRTYSTLAPNLLGKHFSRGTSRILGIS